MTVLSPEVAQPQSKAEIPVDTIVSQVKPEVNIPQETPQNLDKNKAEQKEPEVKEDPDWRAFREARKKDRAEREAAERRAAEKEQEVAALKAAMEAAFATKTTPSPQAYQQYYGINQGNEQIDETEEQRIERKVNELLSKKEEQYKKDQVEFERREYPNRIKRDFPDFGLVCSQDNLDYLDYHYPEVSRPLQRLSEGYDKWHDIYHAVKKFIPNHSTAQKEAMRAEINGNKPRSISSPGPTPPGTPVRQSWQDVEARRAENYARMQRIIKGV